LWAMRISILGFMLLLLTISYAQEEVCEPKINGVNFMGAPKPIDVNCMQPVKFINANWVALNPFGYAKKGEPNISFDNDWQWWGERPQGVVKCIEYARTENLKVLIKPHVWVMGQGWPGEFEVETEEDWLIWEETYTAYILALAKIAEEKEAEMLAIGTEFRLAVRQRPQFWHQLINEVRKIYNGKLTYAANWDNYEYVTFWDELDYIGIDNYYPLNTEDTPSVNQLLIDWEKPYQTIKKFAEKLNKKVIFTEYGYRSISKTAGPQWELEDKHTDPANLLAQQNAYEAIFKTFWTEDWMVGGFLWKWRPNDAQAGGHKNNDYTPQNKPVEALIREWYGY